MASLEKVAHRTILPGVPPTRRMAPGENEDARKHMKNVYTSTLLSARQHSRLAFVLARLVRRSTSLVPLPPNKLLQEKRNNRTLTPRSATIREKRPVLHRKDPLRPSTNRMVHSSMTRWKRGHVFVLIAPHLPPQLREMTSLDRDRLASPSLKTPKATRIFTNISLR